MEDAREELWMKKGMLLVSIILIVLTLGGCGDKALEGNCECVVRLTEIPKELSMLEDSLEEKIYINVYLKNIYTEEDMSIRLTAESGFKQELHLKPGTYKVTSCSAGPSNLLPMEVEAGQESFQLTANNEAMIEVAVTNMTELQDYIWHTDASREVLEADAFSHMVQFEGQLIDLKNITDYVTFQSDEQIRPGKQLTIRGKEDKGVSITVMNEGTETTSWQNCKLLGVTFHKNNIVWGQGASIGMDVTKAVHAESGLYGKPDSMAGSIMARMDQENTRASWIDETSGDKLTLTITASGDYVLAITYEFAVFE